ncbi:MAG: hypothetical protein R3C10_00020 [Pirellulales bacterium]
MVIDAVALSHEQCQAINIDDFSVCPITVSRTGSDPAEALQTGLDEHHVLGGQRGILVGEAGSETQTAVVNSAAGVFEFSTDDSFGYLDLLYGTDEKPLNIDLTADGSTAFVLYETDSDVRSAILNIYVDSSTGRGATRVTATSP